MTTTSNSISVIAVNDMAKDHPEPVAGHDPALEHPRRELMSLAGLLAGPMDKLGLRADMARRDRWARNGRTRWRHRSHDKPGGWRTVPVDSARRRCRG